MNDTIVALSSGALPAGIAVVRLSGSLAMEAAASLCGTLPPPRHAAVRVLRDAAGEVLDRAVVVVFPGPASFSGEDIVELHLHGGKAVVRAVQSALLERTGIRSAEPGEFTRRALIAGRIDLTEAEGLGDLLAAETDAQRRAALRNAEGALRGWIEDWSRRTVTLSAMVEAVIDHEDDEADIGDGTAILNGVRKDALHLAVEIERLLAAPPAERLRDGIRVTLAGPPNSGKSTLFNALIGRDAAIVSPIAGTTRDRIEAPVTKAGIAWLFVDTAGLAAATDDPVEAIGIDRSRQSMVEADIVLWLGDGAAPIDNVVNVHARADEAGRADCPAGRVAVEALKADGTADLWDALVRHGQSMVPASDAVVLNSRQMGLCRDAAQLLRDAASECDSLFLSEELRQVRRIYDALTGRADVEAVLDAVFGNFCIGK